MNTLRKVPGLFAAVAFLAMIVFASAPANAHGYRHGGGRPMYHGGGYYHPYVAFGYYPYAGYYQPVYYHHWRHWHHWHHWHHHHGYWRGGISIRL